MIIFSVILIHLAFHLLFAGKASFTLSDHRVHLFLIKRIKENENQFLSDYLIGFNEQNLAYPQLYHWVLSFLPEWLYKEKYEYIGIVIKIAEIVAFNIFLFHIQSILKFPNYVIFHSNIIFNLFPFSYVIWNAKNNGLSARGIGLIIGQIYLYLILCNSLGGSIFLIASIFIVVLVAILTSQMALQFIILSLPFFVFIFNLPLLIIFPFAAYFLFFLLLPKTAKSYLVGQYNHKRNYALFLSEIFILKIRYSIWRDFVYDFWRKGKSLKTLNYIITNPVVESLYGFPYIFLLIPFFSLILHSENILEASLLKIILTCCALFLLTSFRATRFLGEPQRYIEFSIPVISLLFCLKVSTPLYYIYAAFVFLFIVAYKLLWGRYQKHQKTDSKIDFPLEISGMINGSNTFYSNTKIISNDYELLKQLSPLDLKVIIPGITEYYSTKEDFQSQFINQEFKKVSPQWLQIKADKYEPECFILNNDIYEKDYLKITFSSFELDYEKVLSFFQFDIYKRL